MSLRFLASIPWNRQTQDSPSIRFLTPRQSIYLAYLFQKLSNRQFRLLNERINHLKALLSDYPRLI